MVSQKCRVGRVRLDDMDVIAPSPKHLVRKGTTFGPDVDDLPAFEPRQKGRQEACLRFLAVEIHSGDPNDRFERNERTSPVASLAFRITLAEVSSPLAPARATSGIAYYLRVLRVVGAIQFKSKYAGAALGYVWSLVKPLSYFGVLWLVFAFLLRTANQTQDFAIYLLIGILLYTFFTDSISVMLRSIVDGGSILRRLAFPSILVPLSASVGICITFFINISAIVVIVAIQRVTPRIEWLLIPPLLVELYILCVGLGLLLAALYVRFRDVGQIWELATQLLFFASAIFYPIGIVPSWAQKIAFLNPFLQIMQDARHAVLGSSGPNDLTVTDVYGAAGRLIPFAIVLALFVGGFAFFRRESRYFAERV
jgi:ABC-2 type transport system permease protein